MRLSLGQMMLVVAAIALISAIVAHRDRANRRRNGQRMRALHLVQVRQHLGFVRHYNWFAENRFKAVANCLKLAERARHWRPVAPSPEAEWEAAQFEGRAARCFEEGQAFLAQAAYYRRLVEKYQSAADRPLAPLPPDPPPPP